MLDYVCCSLFVVVVVCSVLVRCCSLFVACWLFVVRCLFVFGVCNGSSVFLSWLCVARCLMFVV